MNDGLTYTIIEMSTDEMFSASHEALESAAPNPSSSPSAIDGLISSAGGCDHGTISIIAVGARRSR